MEDQEENSEKSQRTTKRGEIIMQNYDDSPYILHPSDHLGLVFVTTPFTGENFASWKQPCMQKARVDSLTEVYNCRKQTHQILGDGKGMMPWNYKFVILCPIASVKQLRTPRKGKSSSVLTRFEQQY
ncbi:conserved hypothetical protein [Ricinus communis]|uniref:Retrotransposon Copia-like N-terminal domain-containing protein n=1 Tax=Ricinus communis TaxID=3988 RepID=B9R7T1_RICCO|nr:conserved hypothetical protein [Ricinus communis]